VIEVGLGAFPDLLQIAVLVDSQFAYIDSINVDKDICIDKRIQARGGDKGE